jgi:hypothetical protein
LTANQPRIELAGSLMITFRVAFLATAIGAAMASPAAAEQIAWRAPPGLEAVALPPADAARYAARDVRVSRLEATTERGLRRLIISDLPRTGRFLTQPIGQTARELAANVGAGTCTRYSVSDVREFVVDGRASAEFTLICHGPSVGTQIMSGQINVRRTVLVEGQSRLYNFQADEYAEQTETFDAAMSAASWDSVMASIVWCGDTATSCNPN